MLDRVSRAESPDFKRVIMDAAEMRLLVGDAMQRMRLLHPNWAFAAEVRTGNAAAVLVEAAKQFEADLIVIGSHGRTTVGRWMFGSVSDQVLLAARCSVRVARCRYPPPADSPRILAYVGSGLETDSARSATAFSKREWPPGTEVRVIQLQPTLPATQIVEQRRGELARMFWHEGISTTAAIETGDPLRILIEQAKRWEADCVFINRDCVKPRWLAHGPLAELVAERACCSVEVVVDG
jgi:nucleotide-binding universal stress UspA family protein